MGNPLRSGIGDWGASVVLVALVTLALVLFTGVTLRRALGGLARAGTELWELAVPHGAMPTPTSTPMPMPSAMPTQRIRSWSPGPADRRGAAGERPVLFDLDDVLTTEPPVVEPVEPAETVTPEPDVGEAVTPLGRALRGAFDAGPRARRAPGIAGDGHRSGHRRMAAAAAQAVVAIESPRARPGGDQRGRSSAGQRVGRTRGRHPAARAHRRAHRDPLRARARPRGQGGPGHEPGQGHRLRHGVTRRAHPGPDPGQVGHRHRGPQPSAPTRHPGRRARHGRGAQGHPSARSRPRARHRRTAGHREPRRHAAHPHLGRHRGRQVVVHQLAASPRS